MKLTYRKQKPVRNGRMPLPACVLREIRSKVERLSIRYGVSKSWIISKILADALGVEKQEDFK